jgi:hypothetical protein
MGAVPLAARGARVRRAHRDGSCSEGRLCVEPSVGEERSLRGRGVAEGIHRVAVAKGYELRIATALSERGVRSSNSSSSSRSGGRSSVGGLRVKAGVNERHLLQDECEGFRGGNDRALVRAEVTGSRRGNTWRVGGASFRRHFDGGRIR